MDNLSVKVLSGGVLSAKLLSGRVLSDSAISGAASSVNQLSDAVVWASGLGGVTRRFLASLFFFFFSFCSSSSGRGVSECACVYERLSDRENREIDHERVSE